MVERNDIEKPLYFGNRKDIGTVMEEGEGGGQDICLSFFKRVSEAAILNHLPDKQLAIVGRMVVGEEVPVIWKMRKKDGGGGEVGKIELVRHVKRWRREDHGNTEEKRGDKRQKIPEKTFITF
ncbi:hypothetical protein L2E82_12488 [Cichorium intybus]|uniref:Uncharacterized protein n=1 Tax=Cichorium intybus TaxID=13427 RepID=A0ACB9GHG2_CICIN|nr:hypothetical protein L2E82_12488 [Cichorium intybus]